MPEPLSSEPARRTIFSGRAFEDVYGYSRAVRVGNQVHVSGTTAAEAAGADAYEQARDALSIIERALHEAGSSLAAVVRTVTYVTEMDDMELVARAHLEVFGEIRPAATLVEVSRLVDPSLRVEIEVYAVETG